MDIVRWHSQDDDWQVVRLFLPEGWEEQARVLGALRRCRGFEGPEALARARC